MKAEHIYKAFGGKQVLSDISFDFPENAASGITGASGRGKTTLVNILLGLLIPDSGRVVRGENARLACVFQEDRLIEHMNAHKNVRLTAHNSVTPAMIADALAALGLDPRNDDPVSKYSGGMRRRVAIARAVLACPDILILDEPFKGLDIAARENAARFITDSCPKCTRILVAHDPEELELMHAADVLRL